MGHIIRHLQTFQLLFAIAFGWNLRGHDWWLATLAAALFLAAFTVEGTILVIEAERRGEKR